MQVRVSGIYYKRNKTKCNYIIDDPALTIGVVNYKVVYITKSRYIHIDTLLCNSLLLLWALGIPQCIGHSLYRSTPRGPEDDLVESKHEALLSYYTLYIFSIYSCCVWLTFTPFYCTNISGWNASSIFNDVLRVSAWTKVTDDMEALDEISWDYHTWSLVA